MYLIPYSLKKWPLDQSKQKCCHFWPCTSTIHQILGHTSQSIHLPQTQSMKPWKLNSGLVMFQLHTWNLNSGFARIQNETQTESVLTHSIANQTLGTNTATTKHWTHTHTWQLLIWHLNSGVVMLQLHTWNLNSGLARFWKETQTESVLTHSIANHGTLFLVEGSQKRGGRLEKA